MDLIQAAHDRHQAEVRMDLSHPHRLDVAPGDTVQTTTHGEIVGTVTHVGPYVGGQRGRLIHFDGTESRDAEWERFIRVIDKRKEGEPHGDLAH